MKFYKKILCVSMLLTGLVGCGFGAGMDLQVDTLAPSPEYGKLQPRVAADKCQYYTEENAPDPNTYTVLVEYLIKQTPTVITSRSPQTIVCYAHGRAVRNGADTIIVDEIIERGEVPVSVEDSREYRLVMKRDVPPGTMRITPIVKVRAIRFKGEIPSELKQ